MNRGVRRGLRAPRGEPGLGSILTQAGFYQLTVLLFRASSQALMSLIVPLATGHQGDGESRRISASSLIKSAAQR